MLKMTSEVKAQQKQIADIQPIEEDTWKFFNADAFNNFENTFIVAIDQLIVETSEADEDAGYLAGKRNHPVYRAYNYFKRVVEGDLTVKPRVPITVRGNGDKTFTVIDGRATTSAARILEWKVLPVQIIEVAKKSDTERL